MRTNARRTGFYIRASFAVTPFPLPVPLVPHQVRKISCARDVSHISSPEAHLDLRLQIERTEGEEPIRSVHTGFRCRYQLVPAPRCKISCVRSEPILYLSGSSFGFTFAIDAYERQAYWFLYESIVCRYTVSGYRYHWYLTKYARSAAQRMLIHLSGSGSSLDLHFTESMRTNAQENVMFRCTVSVTDTRLQRCAEALRRYVKPVFQIIETSKAEKRYTFNCVRCPYVRVRTPPDRCRYRYQLPTLRRMCVHAS
jgi:hypothetical protein